MLKPSFSRAKRVQKEKPFHFTAMSDVKKRWEQGDHAREERREETKQEIQNIRTKLFMVSSTSGESLVKKWGVPRVSRRR